MNIYIDYMIGDINAEIERTRKRADDSRDTFISAAAGAQIAVLQRILDKATDYKEKGYKNVASVCEDFCQNYCKYPLTWDEEKDGPLFESETCRKCPLEFFEGRNK